jgi:hypothetical protein
MNRMLRHRTRNERGASTTLLVLVIAFFGVLPLALLSFEMSRYFLIQSELQHVTDCAALSGTAALAQPATSSTTTAAAQQQGNAMNAAIANFKSNGVLQVLFNDTNTEANANTTVDNTPPPFQHATINIVLENQQGQPVSTGSLVATTMKVTAAYTDAPVFAGASLSAVQGLFTVRAFSVGGLPQLDIVLCFDVSGSMDDATVVSLVNRHWVAATQQVEYTILKSDTIYNLALPLPTGTSLNAATPQNLSFADYTTPTTNNTNPYIFSEGTLVYNPNNASNTNKLLGLRANLISTGGVPAIPEAGCPPGNFNPANTSAQTVNGNDWNSYPNLGFTDMVWVPPSGGMSVAQAVEASRGNFNDQTTWFKSQGNITATGAYNGKTKVSNQVSALPFGPSVYTNYWASVNTNTLPMSLAQQAAVSFFNQMNQSANVHISLITFASTASGNPGAGTYADSNNPLNLNIDTGWAAGGKGNWTLPYVPLQQNAFVLQDVINAVQGAPGSSPPIPPLTAENGTDIVDALVFARTELTNKALVRPNAKKAIILFTDGVPTVGLGGVATDETTATNAAITEAGNAQKANIPIYTIGLSTNNAITNLESNALGDGTNGSGQGVAFASGNLATYTGVQNAINLQQAFQKIARGLVVLQSQ